MGQRGGVVRALLCAGLAAALTASFLCHGAEAAASDTDAASTEPPTTRRSRPLWNQTETDRLRYDLLMGYDKFARPVAHDQRTEVDIFVILKHVDVDEFRGVMSLDVWLKMFWTDPKLKWKPSQYGNLTTLFVADHEIWQPDLMLYNSASRPDLASSGHDAPYLVVAPDGGVIWVPTTRLETYCDLDLRRWPFDEHTCEYRLGSWVFDKSALDLVTHNDTFTHELHVDAEQWRLLDIHFERKEVLYDNYPESFVDVCLSVTARRRGTAYYSVITGPLSASFFLLLFSFFVPYHRVERLVLHAVNILMLTVALAYMTQVVPILTQKPPYVVEMYGQALLLAVLCTGVSVCLQNLTGVGRPWPLPAAIRRLVSHPGVRPLIAGAYSEEADSAVRARRVGGDLEAILPGGTMRRLSEDGESELEHAKNRRDWYSFIALCERVFCLSWFTVYAFVYIFFVL